MQYSTIHAQCYYWSHWTPSNDAYLNSFRTPHNQWILLAYLFSFFFVFPFLFDKFKWNWSCLQFLFTGESQLQYRFAEETFVNRFRFDFKAVRKYELYEKSQKVYETACMLKYWKQKRQEMQDALQIFRD